MDQSNQKLSEAIEAARPGDLARLDELPELSDLAMAVETDPAVAEQLQATQHADVAIQSALHRAECPDGLAARILQRVAEAEAQNESSADAAEDLVSLQRTDGAGTETVQKSARFTRRHWIALCSVAAMVLVAMLPLVWPRDARTKSDLVALTPVWNKAAGAADWRSDNPPESHPPSGRLAYAPAQVAQFATEDDRNATAYRYYRPLKNVRGAIYLFVVDTRATDLPTNPPQTPDFDSGGIRVGVWAENGKVYALVVLGDDEAYDRMVRVITRAV